MVCLTVFKAGDWRPVLSVDGNIDNEVLSISETDMIWEKRWKQEIFGVDKKSDIKRGWEFILLIS